MPLARKFNWGIEISLGIVLFFLPISKALVEIGTVSAILCWLFKRSVNREPLFTGSFLFWCYLSLLAVIELSLTQVPASLFKEGTRGIFKWLEYFVLFFIAYEQYHDEAKRKKALFLFILSMSLVTLSGYWQLFSGADFLRGHTLDPGRVIRMKSSLGAPNDLASFYLFAIPAAFIFLRERKTLVTRLLAGLVLLNFCFGLILTFSRAAFFAFFAAVILFALLTRHGKWSLSALGILTFLIFIPGKLNFNFLRSISLQDVSLQERFQYWKTAWAMIQTHPWLGIGPNQFQAASPAYLPFAGAKIGHAHNSYLELWAENGIFALILFFLPILYLCGKSLSKKLSGGLWIQALRISLFAFLLQAALDNSLYALQTTFLFWVWWGMFAALSLPAVFTRQKMAAPK